MFAGFWKWLQCGKFAKPSEIFLKFHNSERGGGKKLHNLSNFASAFCPSNPWKKSRGFPPGAGTPFPPTPVGFNGTWDEVSWKTGTPVSQESPVGPWCPSRHLPACRLLEISAVYDNQGEDLCVKVNLKVKKYGLSPCLVTVANK